MPWKPDGEYYYEGDPLELAQKIQDMINSITDGPMYDEFKRVLSIGIPLSYVLAEGFATNPSMEGIEHMEITLNEMEACMRLREDFPHMTAGHVMVLNYVIQHGTFCKGCSFESTHRQFEEYLRTGSVKF